MHASFMNSKEYPTATQVNQSYMIHCELFQLWLAKWKTRSLSVFELAIVDPIDASPISFFSFRVFQNKGFEILQQM